MQLMKRWGGEEGNTALLLDGSPDRSISQDEISHLHSVCSPEIPLIALVKSLQIDLQITLKSFLTLLKCHFC